MRANKVSVVGRQGIIKMYFCCVEVIKLQLYVILNSLKFPLSNDIVSIRRIQRYFDLRQLDSATAMKKAIKSQISDTHF